MKHLKIGIINVLILLFVQQAFAQNNRDITPILSLLLFDGPAPAIYRCEAGKISDIDHPTGTYLTEPNYVDLGEITLFIADTVAHGLELWRTDGTEAGTYLVKDINPGPADGFFGARLSDEPALVRAGSLVYFTATDGVNGRELWVTDGTNSGTRLLKQFSRVPLGSLITNLTEFQGKLFFIVNIAVSEREGLWSSDGTTAGTRLIKSANVDRDEPNSMVVLNNQLIFRMTSRSIWQSNGTTAGTSLLKTFDGDISYPEEFTTIGNKVFFLGDELLTGRELWTTDGTIAGTRMVKDINPDNGDNSGNGAISINIGGTHGYQHNPGVNGRLYFKGYTPQTGRELWVSDGTEAGTRIVRDIDPGPDSGLGNLVIDGGAVLDDEFYFEADISSLWKVNRSGNAVKVSDVGPYFYSRVPEMVANDDFLFFALGRINSSNIELTIYDKQGRRHTLDVFPGSASSFPGYFHVRDDQSVLFITLSDPAVYQVNCPIDDD